MNYIDFNDLNHAMELMDEGGKPIPFSFMCSTKSGKFLIVKNAVKNYLWDKYLNGKKPRQKRSDSSNVSTKDNNEKERRLTINIIDLDKEVGDDHRILKIYPRTIITFNDLKVIP